MKRRTFLAGGAALAPADARRRPAAPARRFSSWAEDFGGATAARYVRLLSSGSIDVTMIEPEPAFVSCPLSNLVLGGSRSLADITSGYEGLAREAGVRRIRATVDAIDPVASHRDARQRRPRRVRQADPVAGRRPALLRHRGGLPRRTTRGASCRPGAPGPETLALRRQLEAMPDGGTFAITIPEAPYRCPPGPYERACQVASYFRQAKPRSKVLILDENADVVSKAALFSGSGPKTIRASSSIARVTRSCRSTRGGSVVRFEVHDDIAADVLNVIPPMQAGRVAVHAGLANSNGRWCRVDYRTFESTVARDIHVIGDAIQGAPSMPKSGHMANGSGESGPRPRSSPHCAAGKRTPSRS